MKKIFILAIITLLSFVTKTIAQTRLYNNVKIVNHTNFSGVDYAAKSLNEDLYRKLGSPVSQQKEDPIIFNLNVDSTANKFDSYKIIFSKNKIDFIGSDQLGLIHSIYSFSQDILGIDPFIQFTNILPEVVKEINIKRKEIVSKPYTYVHRGFFINDEDLITGFQMEKEEYGFNLPFMEKIYETALRNKMTGIIPSTLVLSDEPHLRLASDMGLYIMQHHAEPVGSVPLYWPKDEVYSWKNNRERFIKFWSTAIERQKGKNVIWTLGFRGRLDRDFWRDDTTLGDHPTDKQKADIINDVVNVQYELIKKITGNKDPLVTAIMRGEVNNLFSKGLIHYPPKTIIQFNDGGTGRFLSNTWKTADACDYPKGVYQHVSYHCRRGHMRINIIDPNTLCEEMQKAYDHKLTQMCVLNVGNIKEKIFGIQQMVNYMNDFSSYCNQKNDEYYGWYINDKFHVKSSALEQVYSDFIHNQYHFPETNGVWGDETYEYVVEMFTKMILEKQIDEAFLKNIFPSSAIKKMKTGKDFNEQMNILAGIYIESMNDNVTRWETAMNKAYDAKSILSGNRLDFFVVDAVLPTEKMYHLGKMIYNYFRAVAAYSSKDYHNAQLLSYQSLRDCDAILEVEKKIENNHTGYFKDWYRNDQTALSKEIKQLVTLFHDVCINLKFLNLPYDQRNSKTKTIQYKKEPFFDSKYRGELYFMEDAH